MHQQYRSVITGQEQMQIQAENNEPEYTIFSGYFARFGTLSQTMYDANGTPFKERLVQGCFTKSIDSQDEIYGLAHHQWESVLANRFESGNLKLVQDNNGLRFTIKMVRPLPSYAADLEYQVKNKLIRGCSFGYYPDVEELRQENGEYVVEVRNVILLEGSIVTNPAYLDTSAKVRNLSNLGADRPTQRDLQRIMAHRRMQLDLLKAKY